MSAKSGFLFPVAVAVLSALMVNAQDAPKPQQLPDLVAGLKATQGCLGVETARTSSGKNVIFAWFEDKKAAMRWYTSKVHMQVMSMVGPLPEGRPAPLAGVPNDSGPILAIASITPTDKPTLPGFPFPISQLQFDANCANLSIDTHKGALFRGKRTFSYDCAALSMSTLK